MLIDVSTYPFISVNNKQPPQSASKYVVLQNSEMCLDIYVSLIF